MIESKNPKVTVNEDFVDLRKFNVDGTKKRSARTKKSPRRNSKSPVRSFCIRSEGLHSERELINCGLRNLVTSYNVNAGMYQKQTMLKKKSCISENSKVDSRSRRNILSVRDDCLSLKSKSDLSVPNKQMSVHHVSSSTPLFIRKRTTDISAERIEPLKNKFTMTKNEDMEASKAAAPSKRRTHVRSRSKDFHTKERENLKISVDPRLREKYSILKMPCWKRSWTIPVFSRKQCLQNFNCTTDNFDAQTYLYDEGSEIDSMFIQNKTFFSKVFPSECLIALSVMGAACGILLTSLLIYIIYGNNILQVFFKPREVPDASVKSYIKFVGGGLIYVITKFFRTLGEILSLPSQQVYEPQDPFRWRKNT